MKTHKERNQKMRHLSIALCAMCLVSIVTAKAQETTENQLFSTTGANVLGAGKIELSGTVDWTHFHSTYIDLKTNSIGIDVGARFGVGSRAELTVGIGGETSASRYKNDKYGFFSNGEVMATVGARLLLYKGEKWKPTITFNTNITLPVMYPAMQKQWIYDVQPLIEMQFRNRVGERWSIDYSIGYRWGAKLPYNNFSQNIRYTIYARCLLTEKLMLGFGVENNGGKVDLRYQASPTLQLSAQGMLSAGFGQSQSELSSYTLIGAHWMLK